MTQTPATPLPIIDTHCDLLVYLTDVPGSGLDKAEDIGCSVPRLTAGNVKLQVMALYCPTEPGSTRYAGLQSKMYKQLAEADNCFTAVKDTDTLHRILQSTDQNVGMVAAIENASGFCEEDEPLEDGFKKLEKIIDDCGTVLYISFTHHAANRFGGGNNTTQGITTDGRQLLDYLHGRRIAVDLSHTSDALAHDMLRHIDVERLDIPLLASHSNFRPVWHHNRNLPDELTQELIRRNGLIGMNFLRAFVNDDDPEALVQHILYGINQGAEDALCFGADYFYTLGSTDVSRDPYYFKEHDQAATSYHYILNRLKSALSEQQMQKLAYRNAACFIERIWS